MGSELGRLRAARDHGLALNLAIGPSCFVRCPGCYNLFGQSERLGGLVSADEVTAFARSARESGVSQVTVSGGDPLTHPEIIPILQQLRALGFFVKLDTVGTALLRPAEKVFYGSGTVGQIDPASIAPYVDMIGFPLDGATDQVQKRFRKARHPNNDVADEPFDIDGLRLSSREAEAMLSGPRSFASAYVSDDTPQLIEIMHGLGVDVCVNTVVHRGNAADLRALATVMELLRPDLWQLFEFQASGVLAVRNTNAFSLSEEGSREEDVVPIQRTTMQTDLLDTHHGSFNELVEQARFAAPSVNIQAKSAVGRSKIYFMVNDAGIAWIPADGDSLPERIGHITRDRDVVLAALGVHLEIDAG